MFLQLTNIFESVRLAEKVDVQCVHEVMIHFKVSFLYLQNLYTFKNELDLKNTLPHFTLSQLGMSATNRPAHVHVNVGPSPRFKQGGTGFTDSSAAQVFCFSVYTFHSNCVFCHSPINKSPKR